MSSALSKSSNSTSTAQAPLFSELHLDVGRRVGLLARSWCQQHSLAPHPALLEAAAMMIAASEEAAAANGGTAAEASDADLELAMQIWERKLTEYERRHRVERMVEARVQILAMMGEVDENELFAPESTEPAFEELSDELRTILRRKAAIFGDAAGLWAKWIGRPSAQIDVLRKVAEHWSLGEWTYGEPIQGRSPEESEAAHAAMLRQMHAEDQAYSDAVDQILEFQQALKHDHNLASSLIDSLKRTYRKSEVQDVLIGN